MKRGRVLSNGSTALLLECLCRHGWEGEGTTEWWTREMGSDSKSFHNARTSLLRDGTITQDVKHVGFGVQAYHLQADTDEAKDKLANIDA